MPHSDKCCIILESVVRSGDEWVAKRDFRDLRGNDAQRTYLSRPWLAPSI
jgi:hypothetical protein